METDLVAGAAGIEHQFEYDGPAVTTLTAGALLVAMGFAQLDSVILLAAPFRMEILNAHEL